MKTYILKPSAFLFLFMLINKLSFSQHKQETIPQVVLPESYYKGQEEKRKYAESHSPGGANTMTVASIQPQQEKKAMGLSPDIKAKNLLNTPNIPADFPIYNSATISEKEYEAAVYKWFKANPSFRKINK